MLWSDDFSFSSAHQKEQRNEGVASIQSIVLLFCQHPVLIPDSMDALQTTIILTSSTDSTHAIYHFITLSTPRIHTRQHACAAVNHSINIQYMPSIISSLCQHPVSKPDNTHALQSTILLTPSTCRLSFDYLVNTQYPHQTACMHCSQPLC